VNPRPTSHLPPRVASPHLWVLGIAAIIVIAVVVAYRGTFSVPFVLDDPEAITDNYTIRSFSTAWMPPKDTTVSGRPIVNLTLAVNYALGGLDVGGYHAVNLGIHLLAALTLFGVVRRTLLNPRVPPALARDATFVAGGIALLWALHPLQTESVTYTIQRTESLMGLFYLFTLYAFIRATTDERSDAGGRFACFALSVVACLLGMATKEVMVSAPLLVLLYDRTFVAGTFRDALRQRGWYYTSLAATWIVLAALVISSEGRGGTAGLGAKIPPLDYALTQCTAIVRYLRLTFWPAPLVFDYGMATVTQPSVIIGPALLLLALVAGTLWALRTRPIFGFLGAWFFALLAPSSSVVPIATQTIAEHRMYLALAAVLTLVVVALYRGLGRSVALITTFAVAIGFIVVTSHRNTVYRDPLTLWTDTLTKAPDNSRAITNVGLALIALGRVPEAQQHFAAAVRRLPNVVDLRINHANALTLTGRFDEALAEITAALQLDPANFQVHGNLGITLAQSGRVAEALPHFTRAVELKPSSAENHRNLALALAQAGQPAESLIHFATAVRLRPTDPLNRDLHGFALLQARRLPEAIAEFEAALRLDPGFAKAHYHLGLALNQSGRAAEGLAHLEQAVQLVPNDAEIVNHLGIGFATAGRMADALRQFERAVKLRPGFTEAIQNRDRAREELSGR
jgi:Flp pilus assembly protein TadD